MKMKVLIFAIFVSCASTINATLRTKYSTSLSTIRTYPSDDYCPIQEIKTCGFKYGPPAAKKEFPYVAFLKSRNEYKVQYCSGSLIHPKWVLTSAYCTLPESIVEVTLGALIPFDDKDPDRVVVQTRDVYTHPGYIPRLRSPKNDVALIKLPRSVRTGAIIPIPLKTDSEPISEHNITFAAWGESGYESLSSSGGMLIFKGPCKCSERIWTYEDPEVDSEFFCCRSIGFLCFLHNGGGLVVQGALVGVMSLRCYSHCRDHRAIFTNMYNQQQWISDTMDSQEEDDIPDTKVYGACSDIPGFNSGVYLLQPNKDMEPFEAYCELRLDGEKWTVIQQRFSDAFDFYRNYANYTNGFGSIAGNHWLGLEKIHQLTKNGDHELYVDLRAHNFTRGYAQYHVFKVDSAETGFKLTISGFWLGNAGDSMTENNGWLNGMKFSTYDRDQDEHPHMNCAEENRGAWWYNACSASNLNGPYHNSAVGGWRTMCWVHNFGPISLKTARMMIKKK